MKVARAQAAILHNLTRRGLELKDFGRSIGQCQKTGYNKFKNPRMLTVEDLLLMKVNEIELKEIVS